MNMSFEFSVCAMVVTVAICTCIGCVHSQEQDQKVTQLAITSGLVQQVVHVSTGGSTTIWVKPPAPSLVEESK